MMWLGGGLEEESKVGSRIDRMMPVWVDRVRVGEASLWDRFGISIDN